MKVSLILLTRNADSHLKEVLNSVRKQVFPALDLLVIDTASRDGTAETCRDAGFKVIVITEKDFNHGATRDMAWRIANADVVIFMTQDAILSSSASVRNILAPFEDEKVGAVCGRQLPHADATPIAAHARLFNYPATSSVASKANISEYGIKAAFLSNSFAAYRCTALAEVGGFPKNAILSEDTYVAAKMLQVGYKVVYCAEATCYHSHNYSILEECSRYFDIGVFHGRESWYLALLGRAEGEGKRFALSEMRYLIKHSPVLVPAALIRTVFKLVGYKLGQYEQRLPLWFKRKLSMNKGYWR